MKNLKNPQTLLKILAIALMLAIAVVQFLPFWQVAEDKTASINGYVWFPNDHKDVTKYLKAEVGSEVDIYTIIPAPIATLVFAALAILALLKMPKLPLSAICGLIVGVVGLWNLPSCPAYPLGATYTLQLVLYGITLAVSAVSCLWAIIAKAKAA